MERLDLQAQTLYAELLQRSLSDALGPTLEKLGRAFVSKQVRGNTYWYLQHRDTAGMKQTYLGRETPELLATMAAAKQAGAAVAPDLKRREELCAAIRAMGFPKWPRPFTATLETLANAGLFEIGAMLVGTPAYVACIAALGYRSEIGHALTGDIDLQVSNVRREQSISVPGALERVRLGFFPVPGLDPRRPSTSFKVRDGDLMVQFLTSGEGEKPVPIEALGTAALPLPYMEYLSPEPMKAALPFGAGVLVNVPEPARLAWHKLVVCRSRPRHERTKAQKDVEQAADLIVALAQSDVSSLREALADARARGEDWRTKIREGMERVKAQRPDAAAALVSVNLDF